MDKRNVCNVVSTEENRHIKDMGNYNDLFIVCVEEGDSVFRFTRIETMFATEL